jgi:hypothetical protein
MKIGKNGRMLKEKCKHRKSIAICEKCYDEGIYWQNEAMPCSCNCIYFDRCAYERYDGCHLKRMW